MSIVKRVGQAVGLVNESMPDINTTGLVDGFGESTAALSHQSKTRFINEMGVIIFERIFSSAIEVTELEEYQESTFYRSFIGDYNEGLLSYMASGALKGEDKKIYLLRLSNDKYRATDKKPNDESLISSEIKLNFSCYPLSRTVRAIVGMLFDCLNTAAKGINASQALKINLEELTKLSTDNRTKEAVFNEVRSLESALRKNSVAVLSERSKAEYIGYDVGPSKEGIALCYSLLSAATGFPVEFFNGIGGSSLSDTGESTARMIYKESVKVAKNLIVPCIDELYNSEPKIKPYITSLDQLSTIEPIIEDSIILNENDKRAILGTMGLEGVEDLNDIQGRETSNKDSGKPGVIVGEDSEAGALNQGRTENNKDQNIN